MDSVYHRILASFIPVNEVENNQTELQNNIEDDDDALFSENRKTKKHKKSNKKNDYLNDDLEDDLEIDFEDDLEEDLDDEEIETTNDDYRSLSFEDKLILELKSLGFDF